MFLEAKYKRDQYVLKIFGSDSAHDSDKRIKLIRMNVLRTSGVEDDSDKRSTRGSVNTEKLDESIFRARSKIFELAFCNDWDWFFTGTLNAELYDRSKLDKWHKDLTQWIRDYNKKHHLSMKFLFIPELHADGVSWHMHGFLSGLPQEHLVRFQIGDKMSKSLAEKVRRGDAVYNWLPYMRKFGFCDLEPIRNPEAISKYISKYINKNLATSVTELNAHMYYHSRGLRFAQVIKKGSMSMGVDTLPICSTYSNEYCDIYWFPYSDELLMKLREGFI